MLSKVGARPQSIATDIARQLASRPKAHGSAAQVGSQIIKSMADQDIEDMRAAVMDELDRAFRPEFLNRIDEIILSYNLTREHIKATVEVQLA